MTTFPVKVYWWPADYRLPRMLSAKNQRELDALVRIGWKLARVKETA